MIVVIVVVMAMTKRSFFPVQSATTYKLTPTTLQSYSKVVLANQDILSNQVAPKVVKLHNIKDPYLSKNWKQEPATSRWRTS